MERVLTSISKTLHIVSSGWVLILAGVIFVDVMGRAVFNHPLLGTAEIVKNSIDMCRGDDFLSSWLLLRAKRTY